MTDDDKPEDTSKVLRIVPKPLKNQEAASTLLRNAEARLANMPAQSVYGNGDVIIDWSSGLGIREILGALQMSIQMSAAAGLKLK
jgi:hypothetical protein